MNHQEFRRMIPGADMAVLMIHGIVGSPDHFDDLIPLIPENWSVVNLLLAGHGQGAAEFAAASMEKWKAQAARELDALLQTHKKVLLVGHSMGTLFAVRGAVNHPDRVAGLVLLAAPMRARVTLRAALAGLKLALGKGEGDPTAMAMRKDSSVELDFQLWQYLSWIPRFAELLLEIRRVRKLLPRLQVKTAAFHSCRDELVSNRACSCLEKNGHIRVIQMKNSGHFGYEGEDLERLLKYFRKMITDCLRRGR